jgi:hypothetical protein
MELLADGFVTRWLPCHMGQEFSPHQTVQTVWLRIQLPPAADTLQQPQPQREWLSPDLARLIERFGDRAIVGVLLVLLRRLNAEGKYASGVCIDRLKNGQCMTTSQVSTSPLPSGDWAVRLPWVTKGSSTPLHSQDTAAPARLLGGGAAAVPMADQAIALMREGDVQGCEPPLKAAKSEKVQASVAHSPTVASSEDLLATLTKRLTESKDDFCVISEDCVCVSGHRLSLDVIRNGNPDYAALHWADGSTCDLRNTPFPIPPPFSVSQAGTTRVPPVKSSAAAKLETIDLDGDVAAGAERFPADRDVVDVDDDSTDMQRVPGKEPPVPTRAMPPAAPSQQPPAHHTAVVRKSETGPIPSTTIVHPPCQPLADASPAEAAAQSAEFRRARNISGLGPAQPTSSAAAVLPLPAARKMSKEALRRALQSSDADAFKPQKPAQTAATIDEDATVAVTPRRLDWLEELAQAGDDVEDDADYDGNLVRLPEGPQKASASTPPEHEDDGDDDDNSMPDGFALPLDPTDELCEANIAELRKKRESGGM